MGKEVIWRVGGLEGEEGLPSAAGASTGAASASAAGAAASSAAAGVRG